MKFKMIIITISENSFIFGFVFFTIIIIKQSKIIGTRDVFNLASPIKRKLVWHQPQLPGVYSGLEGKLWYLIAWVFPMRLFQKSLEVISVLPIEVCY